MVKISQKKHLVKVFLLAFGLLILIPSLTIASYGGINYYQAKKLFNEAESFIVVEKYDEAIERLAIANSKWVPDSFKGEIETNIILVNSLKEDKDNFEKGIQYYDEGKYEDAKESLEKVPNSSRYYDETQEKLKDLAKKIEAEEAGAKTEVRGTATTTVPVQVTAPVSQQAPSAEKDSICRNEAELYKMQKKEAAIAEAKSRVPHLFYPYSYWLTQNYSQSELQILWTFYQDQYNQLMIGFEDISQRLYLEKYNECLEN